MIPHFKWSKFFISLLLNIYIAPSLTNGQALDCPESDTYYSTPQLAADGPTKECRLLRVYSRSQQESMEPSDMLKFAKYCACQLSQMQWRELFIESLDTETIYRVYNDIMNEDRYRLADSSPKYLWSDVDIVVEGVSVRTSMSDYFKRKTLRRLPDHDFMKRKPSETSQSIGEFCAGVGLGQSGILYGYMENLQRFDANIFFRLLDTNQDINITYQASKFCKLIVVDLLQVIKLKPSFEDLVVANPKEKLLSIEEDIIQRNIDESTTTSTTSSSDENDIDTALRHASLKLLNCGPYQRIKKDFKQLLDNECSILDSSDGASKWLQDHSNHTTTYRTNLALSCGCQLLAHKSNWAHLMEDEDVKTMSGALTNYMNLNRFPDVSKSPIWAIHGWFEQTLEKFKRSRKPMIKEIIKYLHQDQDPKEPINGETLDVSNALEILRRGCNVVMFSTGEAKIVKYLDNLHFLSMDPQFVFHLTLQDSNLFKLHALSKICKPVIR